MQHFLQHRQRILLIVLLTMLVVQPLSHGVLYGLIIFDVLLSIMAFAVLTIVFQRHRERLLALTIAIPTILGNVLLHGLPQRFESTALFAWHGLMVLYLGFAMCVILRDIFRRGFVSSDDMIGVLCGYIISGIAWGDLYIMVTILIPESFTFSPQIAEILSSQNGRRFAFTDYSFVTLTSLGSNRMTAVHPLACALSWLEAMFGQFYLAIVVAQLVGLKMAKHSANHAAKTVP